MVTILSFMLFLGDFTVKADRGMWIDYARSRQISENRYLIQQQFGKKGDYGQGGLITIHDADGEALYQIGGADDAWILLNGVLGDEDTYFYQNRRDPAWYLWHPDYGSKAIHGLGEMIDEHGIKIAHVSKAGHLYFYEDLAKTVRLTEIQFLTTEPSELFEVERPPYRRQIHTIHGNPDFVGLPDAFGFHYYVGPGGMQPSTYYRYSFDVPDSERFKQIDMGVGFSYMNTEGRWKLLSRIGFGDILHDGEKPLLIIPDGMRDDDFARRLRAFAKAFRRAAVNADGNRLSYIDKNVLYELDLDLMRFNTYQLTGKWNDHQSMARPNSRSVFKVTHQMFQVKKAPAISTKNLERLSSTEIPDGFFPDESLRGFQVKERFEAPNRDQ